MRISMIRNLLVTLLLALGLAMGGMAPAMAADSAGTLNDSKDVPTIDKEGDEDELDEWTEEDEYGW